MIETLLFLLGFTIFVGLYSFALWGLNNEKRNMFKRLQL